MNNFKEFISELNAKKKSWHSNEQIENFAKLIVAANPNFSMKQIIDSLKLLPKFGLRYQNNYQKQLCILLFNSMLDKLHNQEANERKFYFSYTFDAISKWNVSWNKFMIDNENKICDLERWILNLSSEFRAPSLRAIIYSLAAMEASWSELKPIHHCILSSFINVSKKSMKLKRVSRCVQSFGIMDMKWDKLSNDDKNNFQNIILRLKDQSNSHSVAHLIHGLGQLYVVWLKLNERTRECIISNFFDALMDMSKKELIMSFCGFSKMKLLWPDFSINQTYAIRLAINKIKHSIIEEDLNFLMISTLAFSAYSTDIECNEEVWKIHEQILSIMNNLDIQMINQNDLNKYMSFLQSSFYGRRLIEQCFEKK
eukprot:gene4319-6118_t